MRDLITETTSKRIFETSETLEATVASERIAQLIAKTEKVLLIPT